MKPAEWAATYGLHQFYAAMQGVELSVVVGQSETIPYQLPEGVSSKTWLPEVLSWSVGHAYREVLVTE